MTLPTDAQARKAIPVFSGVIDYFPDAIAAVAELSRKGNDQHNPGQPLFWNRQKSGDEADTCLRHLMEAGTVDTDGVRHSVKAAWRALALAQKDIELARHRTAEERKAWLAANGGAYPYPPGRVPPLATQSNDTEALARQLDQYANRAGRAERIERAWREIEEAR